MTGLSTSGSISFGWAFVAGRKRVPQPAAGKTAFRTRIGPRGTGETGSVEDSIAPVADPHGGAAAVPATYRREVAKRRIRAEKASAWSRLVRCVAPRTRARRGLAAASANDRSVGRKKRSNSPLISRLGPGYAARRGLNRSPT